MAGAVGGLAARAGFVEVRIGFLGTGAITSAVVTGLSCEGHAIRLSPLNSEIAADLARQFPMVAVAASNQQVLDECEVAVIAVRPQIAHQVISGLQFREDHDVISLVSGLRLGRLRELVHPARSVARAVPLPSAARRRCPTAIFPRDRAAIDLFTPLGAAFAVDSEDEFDALCTATATMATYFAFADGVASWLARHGIAPGEARDYVARIFSGMAQTALDSPDRGFREVASEHPTRGGTNEQVLNNLTRNGVCERLSEALDGVMRRLMAASP